MDDLGWAAVFTRVQQAICCGEMSYLAAITKRE